MATHERVWFRLIKMPCCGFLFCNVNPRLPLYCPECGNAVFLKIKNQESILISDPNATLTIKE
jgi:predicted  nucleic acid-binding Zn-ribbon protein